MAVPQLRPLGIGEILDVALKLWRHHFPALARVVAVIVVPLELLSSVILASAPAGSGLLFDPMTTEPADDEAAAVLAALLMVLALSGIGFLLSSAASLRAVSVAYLGGEPQWRESVQTALRRLGPLIWLAALMTMGLSLATLMLVVPGVWLVVAWSLAPAALVAEGRRGTAALRRSFSLVRGRWWAVFATLAVAFVLRTIAAEIITLPFALAGPETGTFGAFAALTVANIAAAVVTTPFMAAVFVLVYFDLRVRKEGFDLELLVAAMEEDAGAGAAPGRADPLARAAHPPAQAAPRTAPRPDRSPVDPSWPPPGPAGPPPPPPPPPPGWPPSS